MTDYSRYFLTANPFEPSASGLPITLAPTEEPWIPPSWEEDMGRLLGIFSQAKGTKAIAIVGEYGSGKSYILQWLHRTYFPGRRVKSFYFQDPGVQFYALANMLLSEVGRKNFTKSIWELIGPKVNNPVQKNLLLSGYEEYLKGQAKGFKSEDIVNDLAQAIVASDITADEDVANRFARIVAETQKKPYFEYRDFVAGPTGSLVPEKKKLTTSGQS